jgi:hypothetical protein
MHSLEANLALHHALEPALLLLLGAISALPSTTFALVEVLSECLLTESLSSGRGEGSLTEEGARGAEDGVCGGGHNCYAIVSTTININMRCNIRNQKLVKIVRAQIETFGDPIKKSK